MVKARVTGPVGSRFLRDYPGLASAEREDVGTRARIEECDLERLLAHRPSPAHELVHPRLDERAGARLVDVEPVVVARRPAVEAHREPHGTATARRAEDQGEV